MWRFISGKSRARTLKPRKIRAKKSRRVRMARRHSRRAYSRRSRGGFGGMNLKRGLFPVSGIIAGALIGAGVSTLQEKFLPQVIPFQGAAAGFAVGGLAGAAGALVRDMLKGGTTSGIYANNY
jgi:hypothetical protein